jgi:tetratricopeptide (TPR) repeat protein
MRKAFLSHSSDDAEYVREVASLLGRPRAHIDAWSFEPGEDFREEIRRALDESDVFVFFVSESSLRSSWCRFELDEAELRSIRKMLRHSLAILIGDVDIAELPEWLRRAKVVRHNAPQRSARVIEAALLGPATDSHPFIGRSSDLQRSLRKLTAASPLPRILIASGLEGVGRRSFLRRLVADGLDLDLGPFIVLPQTATIEDLYIEALSAAMLLTRQEAEQQLAVFRAMSIEDQANETGGQLALLAEQGNAPCVIDRGSMFDNTSSYLEVYRLMFERFLQAPDAYLCVIHRRSPRTRDLSQRSSLLEQRLSPLAEPDSQALVTRLLREVNARPSTEEATRLAEQTAGYPPAAYYLAAQVDEYGLDVVLNSVDLLREFHSGRFAQFIDELNLGDREKVTLSYLADEITLPLRGIAAATGQSLEETSEALQLLVDLNLVQVVDREYMVAAPIQATVQRGHRVGLDRRWYKEAFARLEEEYWSAEQSLPPISVVDATLRAGFRIGNRSSEGYGTLVRPSLLINAAQERYHQRAYDDALDYTERAETLGGMSPALLEVKVKALAQLKRYGDARKALKSYREFGERRQWYLDGFIDRRAGRHDRACDKFQKGYAQGDRSLPLLRDYADSLLRCGAGEQALKMGTEAREREPRDPFVLDLFARIAISVGTTPEAEEALDALDEIDGEKRFILHRRAWFLIRRRGNAESGRQAAQLAERACKRKDAPLEAYVAWARALIIAREWPSYAKVKQLISQKTGHDVRRITDFLECRAFLQRDDWRHAEQALHRAHYPADRTVDVEIRILEEKSRDQAVLLTERKAAEAEVKRLRQVSADSPTMSVDDLLASE